MSKRLPILILSVCLPLAAAATESEAPDAQAANPPAAEAPVKKPVQCAATTGSRIRPNPASGCESRQAFRSYNAEELQRSGEINLAEALRKLDPIFR